MSVVEADFSQRCHEIENYLQYLMGLEAQTGIDVTLMATMKASAMLMIYNLVESTASNSIESIYDHMRASGLGFVAADDNIKAMALKCARKSNPKSLVKKMRDELLDLAVAAFKKEMIFSGNVDAMKIREIWDEYGVARSHDYKEDALLEVKSARNDLAHGTKSFSELGRSLSVNELVSKHNRTKSLLEKAVKDMSIHILGKIK
jgi:hypothetical protein